jgi:hypothetical protein
MDPNSQVRKWLLWVGFCFALCTVMALSEAASSYLTLMKFEKPIT